jgi:hypothetical protein
MKKNVPFREKISQRFVIARFPIIAISAAIGMTGQALNWPISTCLAALVLTQMILVTIALLP